MASTYENFVGLHPQMTLVNSQTGQVEVLPKNQVVMDDPFVRVTKARTEDPYRHVTQFKDTSKGTIDDTLGIEGIKEPRMTAKAVEHYADACAYLLKGGAAIGNGYIAKMSAETKAMAYNFTARQNRRAADLLLMNQVEITRAAQMDANQYRITGVNTKEKQITGMAASGFAVGKGTYRNTLNTTEARVNYNVANLMLTADLKNAELTRKAGQKVAEAIISDANASIARREGRVAVLNGWISGISNFISAGAAFYCGRVANGGLSTNKGQAVDPMQVKSANNLL